MVKMMVTFPCHIEFSDEQFQNLYDVYYNGKKTQRAFGLAVDESNTKLNPYGSVSMGALGFVVNAAENEIAVYATSCRELYLDEDFYANGITKVASIELRKETVVADKKETLNNILKAIDVCSKQGQTVDGIRFAALAVS